MGINTLIKSQTGSYVGYSFAIPESIVRKVVVDLKEYGIVQRALLGIRYGIVDQDFIDNMGEETGIRNWAAPCQQRRRRRFGFGGRYPQG